MAAEKRFHAVAKGGAATTPTTSSPLSFMKSKLVLLVSHELSLSGKHKKKKKKLCFDFISVICYLLQFKMVKHTCLNQKFNYKIRFCCSACM